MTGILAKRLAALATAGFVAVAALAAPSPAQARGWHHHGFPAGALFGGLVAGAIIGGALSNPYYGPGPYYGPPPPYGPDCYVTHRRVWWHGQWVLQPVEVCD